MKITTFLDQKGSLCFSKILQSISVIILCLTVLYAGLHPTDDETFAIVRLIFVITGIVGIASGVSIILHEILQTDIKKRKKDRNHSKWEL